MSWRDHYWCPSCCSYHDRRWQPSVHHSLVPQPEPTDPEKIKVRWVGSEEELLEYLAARELRAEDAETFDARARERAKELHQILSDDSMTS